MHSSHDQEREPFAGIARKLNPKGKLRECRPLTGGISAATTYIEVETEAGAISRCVVRQHGESDLKRDPEIAKHEFELLHILNRHGIPVAQPIMYDQSCELLPGPYIVVDYIDGYTELQSRDAVDHAEQLAVQLAAIHRAAVSRAELPFLGDIYEAVADKLKRKPAKLDDSLSEHLIREALAQAWPDLPRDEGAILHGDYWPGNVLWKDGKLAAVIDWEDAAWGDPLSDAGNARLELLWAYGEEAMEAFTRRYRMDMPHLELSTLPYWDLCAALRPASQLSGWGLDPAQERIMRERHGRFVRQALASRA